uniref:Uncharacterized protein n=1 Tax=Equus asinus asinus TaxID=83772 RepID=A0A8C4MAZ9_EQUAS
MGPRQLSWSHQQKFGQGSHSCHMSSNWKGLIQKHALNMCFIKSYLCDRRVLEVTHSVQMSIRWLTPLHNIPDTLSTKFEREEK